MPPASALARGYQDRIRELLRDPAAVVDLVKSAKAGTPAVDDGKPLPAPSRPLSALEVQMLEEMDPKVRATLRQDEVSERVRHAAQLHGIAAGLPPKDAAPLHSARLHVLNRPGVRAEQ
jgi:hypothetical protein